MNLTNDFEACNQCESCKSFNESRAYNIHELDAASNNSVDGIRTLIDQVRIPPQVGKYSIYIIDEVHMLSMQAFNAFLKTLEEPPKHAIFILATTEKHKIIPTILSRCQIFDFNRIKVEDIVQYLTDISDKEKVTYEADALNIIAQKADGSMRDALSIYDQIVSFSGNNITYNQVIENLNILDYDYYFRMTDACLESDLTKAFLCFNEILENGFDGHIFIAGLSSHFRNLLVCKDHETSKLLEVGASIRDRYMAQSAKCSPEFLFDALNICNNCDIYYKTSINQRLHVELHLVQLCQIITGKKKVVEEDKKEDKQATSLEHKNSKTTESPAITKNIEQESKKSKQESSEPVYKSISKVQTPSLKEVLSKDLKKENQQDNKTSQNQEQEKKGRGNAAFTREQLNESWKKFMNTIKDSKPRMYSTLYEQKPELKKNNVLLLKLNNVSQLDDFNKNIKSDLIIFLKENLKNQELKIDTYIPEKEDSENLLYTSEEKLEHMIKKNPNLSKLKQKFNLDFD